MADQYLLALVSAVIGGFVGALFAAYVPRFLNGPRLTIAGIELQPSSDTFNLVVRNRDATAALNAVGRITIRPIGPDSIAIGRDQALEARKRTEGDWTKQSYWRKTLDSFLYADDWRIGIEAEHVFWATHPNPVSANVTPGLPERLLIGYSSGQWVDIATETPKIRRARLKLAPDTGDIGEVVVGAENRAPAKPYRFQISLWPTGKALIHEYSGPLPRQAGKT